MSETPLETGGPDGASIGGDDGGRSRDLEAIGDTTVGEDRLREVLRETLSWSREREYAGPDYADGMSSRLLRAVPVENRWLNLAVQETVKRAPVNVRPLFLVETRRNYMGAGLFAMANLVADRLEVGTTDPTVDFERETRALLEWLVENRCRGYSGFCGGHRHEIQTFEFKSTPEEPSVVSTAYPVRALLAGRTLEPSYGDVALSAVDFLLEDLAYRETDAGAVIDYYPGETDDYDTINAVALGARLLLDCYAHSSDDACLERARALLAHVATLQRDCGGWYYREPADASHLSMDSFHNGFILEAFGRYADLADDRFADVLADGLSFYATLFSPAGAPRWDESSRYPRDVHACAQGILVFTYEGRLRAARKIIEWTLAELYDDGRFYVRKHRYYRKRITLMRWCQAWMAYAIAEHLRVTAEFRQSGRFSTAVE